VAERVAVGAGRPGVLTQHPVEGDGGVPLRGVPLDTRSDDVAHGLVDATGLAPIDEAGSALGEAVRDLVTRDVERGEGPRVATVTVAVVHRRPVPERVDEVLADMDVALQELSGPVDGV